MTTTTDGPKTNNHVEGFNLKLLKHTGLHPNIFKLVSILQKLEAEARAKYSRFLQGHIPNFNKAVFEKQQKIKDVLNLFKKKKINLTMLIDTLASFIGDQKKRKNRKKE